MSVIVTRDGPVTIVTIDRPARRNAVDMATATALYDAFRAAVPRSRLLSCVICSSHRIGILAITLPCLKSSRRAGNLRCLPAVSVIARMGLGAPKTPDLRVFLRLTSCSRWLTIKAVPGIHRCHKCSRQS